MASSVREVSASLDDIRKLQKRTRDKEYRLRKQNADQEKIAKVSPRKQWSEVLAMTPQQRKSYAKRLNNFNKHQAYVGSASGDVIPKRYIIQARKLMVAHNKFVERETKRIQGIAPQLWEQYRAKQKGLLAHQESVGGLLTLVDMSRYEKPRSLEVAKRRVKNFEARAKHDFKFYRRIQKRSMMSMLETLGLWDLSELVRNMTADQFDVASSVMPIWESLIIEYEEAASRKPGTRHHPDADRFESIRSNLYKAYYVGGRFKQSELETIASLEKTRKKRGWTATMRWAKNPANVRKSSIV